MYMYNSIKKQLHTYTNDEVHLFRSVLTGINDLLQLLTKSYKKKMQEVTELDAYSLFNNDKSSFTFK